MEILVAGRIGGIDAEELASRFGTPLYVYDLDAISRQVAALRAALPPAVELAYAVKANPALAVVGHLGSLGLGADVASVGELELALKAGIDARKIVMTGPGKRDPELEAAMGAGVRAVTVESRGELARLEAIAAAAGQVVPVLLRAAVPGTSLLERVRLVGEDGAGKFGMGPEDLIEAARHGVRSTHLDLLGLHAFGASNVASAGDLADHFEWTVGVARRVAIASGLDLRLIDAGGGLGIPYDSDSPAVDLRLLGTRVWRLLERMSTDPVTRDARLLLEPGRFFVAAAGVYLAGVIDREIVDSNHLVVLDGGVHHVLRPVLVGQEHRLRMVGVAGGAPLGPTDGQDLSGQRCRTALFRAGRSGSERGASPARGWRPGRGPRRWGIWLYGVDAFLPLPPHPRRGRGQGRSGRVHPAPTRAPNMACLAAGPVVGGAALSWG